MDFTLFAERLLFTGGQERVLTRVEGPCFPPPGLISVHALYPFYLKFLSSPDSDSLNPPNPAALLGISSGLCDRDQRLVLLAVSSVSEMAPSTCQPWSPLELDIAKLDDAAMS